MGLISKIKSLFAKPISISEKDKACLVSPVRGNFGRIKVGTAIEVPNDYRLVATHYNKVCDTLHEGSYKVDDMDMPRLFNLCRKRLVGKDIKNITADLYYINLKEFEKVPFKCKTHVFSKTCHEKVPVKINGVFSFKVSDSVKFMQNMCSEYAVVKNKIALRDLANIFASDLQYLLNKHTFDLPAVIGNEEDIKETLLPLLENLEKSLGIWVNDFDILHVEVPSSCAEEAQQIKALSDIQDELFSQAEIHSQGETNEEPVFVQVGRTEMPFREESAIDNIANSQTRNFGNKTTPIQDIDNIKNIEKTIEQNNSVQQAPNVISSNNSNSAEADISQQNFVQETDKKNEFSSKEDDVNLTKNDIQKKTTKSSEIVELKRCACCGAKNSVEASSCCVCGSKL